MRLGWTKTKYSVSYYVQKTIYVNGKNKSMVVKRLGSEKYICETYGVTDAKAWAKEQVSLMNQAEKEEALPVTMDFFPSRDIHLLKSAAMFQWRISFSAIYILPAWIT